jgi:plastocyanin
MTRRLAALLVLFVSWLVLPLVPAAAATQVVTIGSSLSPKSLTVAPGTTVTWRNADASRHRIRTTSGPAELDSNDLEQGESWSFTFSAAGTYRYVDHRNEENSAYWGTVTVSSSAPAPSGGGTGGTGGTGGGTGGTGGGTAGGAAPAAPSSATVGMAGRAFSPSSVRVAAGGTVTFANTDDRAHTVTASDGSFDSGVVNAGARWSRRFASAGTFRYFCAIHPSMTGTVVVPTASGAVPAPRPAAAAPRPPASGGGAAPAGPAPVPGRPGSARVNVVDFAFTPARLSVHAGDTVSWVNTGQAPHTVTPSGGAPFGTSMLAAGATYRTTVRAVGTFRYVCAFHPQMAGTLEVLPASAALPKPVLAAPAPPAAAPAVSGAPPAADGAGGSASGAAAVAPSGTSRPDVRRVASGTMWSSPIVAWTLWAGVGLAAFLSVAWWRGREVAPR